MMRKKWIRKVAGLLCAASMVCAMAGCTGKDSAGGTGADSGNADSSADAAGQGESAGKTKENGPVAMGRYVEEETDLSEQLGPRPMDLCRRTDGSLVIVCSEGFLISKDQGKSWELETPDWLSDMHKEDAYISQMYMAPDGTAAVIQAVDAEDPDDYRQALTLALPDGTQVPVDMEVTEDEMYVKQVAVREDGGDGVIYASTYRNIYEVQRDGSYDKVLELDYTPQWIWVKDNLLFIDNDWEEVETPAIYDMDAGAFVEDEALVEFVEENYKDRRYNGTDYADMYLLPGEDGTVYLAGKKGIHRHVIGGNMMEQIVDGNLSMLSNPSYSITDMLPIEGDAFWVLFVNGKLIRFTYDPDIPSVPENMVTIYSLRENANIRQAVSLYQMNHPDIFVSYEVGMGDTGSVTREDAVKKLNTEIMAGEGPDLLVMDELPLASYIDKGMLLDLTDYFAQYSSGDPLFDNVIGALMRDGKAYVAPATIGVPNLVYKEDGTENVTDLSGVAEMVEKLRRQYPSEDIIGICNERGILKRFAPTSAPKWVLDGGAIDKEAIGEYLSQCKRIYDAQMEGLDEEIIASYEGRTVRMEEYWGMSLSEMDSEIYMEMLEFIGGMQQLMAGWTNSEYTFVQISSIDRTKGFENTKAAPMQGHCSHVFKPQTMLGINVSSGQIEEAKGFMDAFLSADVQSMYDGLPLNKKAFDSQFTPKEDFLGENGEYGSWATSNGDGMFIEYTSYWPSDEQIAAFREQIAALNTAYIPDKMLEEAVFDQGTAYMSGERSLEQALDGIEKAVAIYMAE